MVGKDATMISYPTPLDTQSGPTLITPPPQASPSRFSGERALVRVLRKHYPNGFDNVCVLDVGCGGGDYRFLFRGSSYTGVDVVDAGFSAKREPGVEFEQKDVADVSFREKFDLVVMNYSLEYFRDDLDGLRKAMLALKPEGLMVLLLPGIWEKFTEWPFWLQRAGGRSITSTVLHHYNRKGLEDLLGKAGLEPVEISSGCGPANFAFKFLQIFINVSKKMLYHSFGVMLGMLPFVGARLHAFFAARRNSVLVLPERKTRQARNYDEFKRIWQDALWEMSLSDHVYTALMRLGAGIDETLWPRASAYFLVTARIRSG